jgi:hypothetical protein
MDKILIKKIAIILEKHPEVIERMTFTQIIERLVNEFNIENVRAYCKSPNCVKRKVLWETYKDISVVSYRTFFRRVEDQGMEPSEAATKPPRPTRPYDKKRELVGSGIS